jgi:hypothetical protein
MIEVMMRLCTRYKSLTLYPIELGGRLGMNPIGVTRGYKSGRDLHALALVRHLVGIGYTRKQSGHAGHQDCC